jgi:hypothetical protein
LFELEITKLTVLGTYTFNLQIGALSKVIVLNVVNPTPKVNMTVTAGATLNSTDGKYYTTLPASGGRTVEFALTLEKMRPATEADTYNLAFTLVRKTPDFDNTIINTASATNKDGGDGDLESAALIAILENENATGDDISAGDGLELSKAGTYTYTLTAGGATQTLTIVVLGYPTVTAEAVMVGTTTLVKFGSNFLVPGSAETLTVHLKGTDLPTTGDVWAQLGSETTTRTKLVFTGGLAPYEIYVSEAGLLNAENQVTEIELNLFTASTGGSAIGTGELSVWFDPTPETPVEEDD